MPLNQRSAFSCATRANLSAPRRRLAAVVAVGALALVSACGSDTPDPTASPSAPASGAESASSSPAPSPSKAEVKASKDLSAVTVSGAAKGEPKVKVKTPWAIDKTRVKVLKPGKGPKVEKSGTVEVNYVGVDARTGKKFDSSFDRQQTAKFPLSQVIPGFQKGLTGQQVGSQVLIAMPGPDAYDGSGGNPQAGIEVGDTLLFVVDIVSTTLTGPDGKAKSSPAGLPKVGSGDDPSIDVPKSDPPSKLEVATLIEGSGEKVTEADVVTVDYKAVSWKSGKVVDSNYAKEPETGPLNTLIPGWQKGLIGKPVGSRVLLVVPPEEGYPEGNETPKIDKGETLVYVVDVLYVQPGQPAQ